MTTTDPVQWTFSATFDASSEACRAAEAWATAEKLAPALALNLALVIEELFTNTIKYGYRQVEGPVRIGLTSQGGMATLTYADQAPAFDSSVAVKNWEPNVELGRVGGVGLHLVQTIGRDIQYRREDGWNVLQLSVSDKRHS